MELNNIIFAIILLFFGYFFNKYFINFLNNKNYNFLIDNDYNKPQAFHEESAHRFGGVLIYQLLTIVFVFLFFSKNIFYFDYISFSTLFFLLGLSDDLKIRIAPKFRLLLMIVFLTILVAYNNFYIEKTGLEFLNYLLKIDVFSLTFICLCFLFIVNGANLIDGFNGLLGIHALIIFLTLFFINFFNENRDLVYILFYISLTLLIFLKFNFPRAKIFLGDSGAYLIGILIAVSTIKTSILMPTISPFFFCIILFYLFFEVFFSFFRKIFVTRKSPLLPDNKHLHMALYKIILSKNKKKFNSNFRVSIFINLIYFLSILPSFFFMYDGLFCRNYFILLLVSYLIFYKILYKKINIRML